MALAQVPVALRGAVKVVGRAANSESPAVAFGGAFLLGLAVVFVVYPAEFIGGWAARFLSLAFQPSDAIEYWQAWRALVEHGAPWPSLWTTIFNHPEGFSIAILDGLPLAATVFRPLLRWLPEGFHYFGLWTAMAVALQGVGAVALMRAAGVRQALPGLYAAFLALSMPVFVSRLSMSHVALASHFLLFFALALCVRNVTAKVPLRFVFPAALALVLAMVTTHPYLGLQGALLGATAIATAQGRWQLRLLAVAATGIVVLGACQALGLFAVASWKNALALGSFGFSLLGTIFGEPNSLQAVTGTHYTEQDTWLGWGCVLLVAACFARPVPRIRNGLLPWLVLAMMVAAISPWIRFGGSYYDLTFLVPDFVVDMYATHRATVRLAWPAVICLSILPLAHVWRNWPRRAVGVLLALAVPLQIYAIYPYWADEYRLARTPLSEPEPLPALSGASRLLVARRVADEGMGTLHLHYAQQLALDTGIPLAGGRFARPPLADHERRQEELRSADDASVRYLAPAPPAGADLPESLPSVPVPVACIRWEILLVCEQRPSTPEHTESSL